MTPNEICLRLNGHELSQFVTVVGTPPDLRFFEENLRSARGKHTVNFSVGDQYIRNHVSFRGPQVDIWNDFESFAISELIDAERKRVAAEQEKARFSDAIEGVFYLNAKTILSLELLPTFDESILSKDPQGTKFFVSHRWQSPGHPYKCRFFHPTPSTVQVAKGASLIPGNLGHASGRPGSMGRSRWFSKAAIIKDHP